MWGVDRCGIWTGVEELASTGVELRQVWSLDWCRRVSPDWRGAWAAVGPGPLWGLDRCAAWTGAGRGPAWTTESTDI